MPGTATYVIQEHADAYVEAIERFVREVRDEEAELESILATVLFTDIVGATETAARLGDRRWQDAYSGTIMLGTTRAARSFAAVRSTQQATASSPRSTARRVRCAARAIGRTRCDRSASRFALACTPENAK